MKQEEERLFEAVKTNNLGYAKELIGQGVNVNVRDDKDSFFGESTPLVYATAMYNKETMELLINNGADVNVKSRDGKTPLHIIANYPSLCQISPRDELIDICELLVTNGADVNAKDAMGDTPLELAVKAGLIKKAEFFLRHGAIWDEGDDPIERARVILDKTKWSNISQDRYYY